MNSNDNQLKLSDDAIYRGMQRIKKDKRRRKAYKRVLMSASCAAMASLFFAMNTLNYMPSSNNSTQSVTCRFQNGDIASTKFIVLPNSKNPQTNAITDCWKAFGLDSTNLLPPINPKLELGGKVNDGRAKCSKTLEIWIETTKHAEICISR